MNVVKVFYKAINICHTNKFINTKPIDVVQKGTMINC